MHICALGNLHSVAILKASFEHIAATIAFVDAIAGIIFLITPFLR